jgi:hypothetical protein
VTVLLAIVLGLVGLYWWERAGLPGSIQWRARRATRRRKAWLVRASPAQLLDEVRRSVQFERWERFPTGRMLMVSNLRDDAALMDAVERLFAEVTDEDREKNQHGRDSNFFEFYDSGLALVLDALEARVSGTPAGSGGG